MNDDRFSDLPLFDEKHTPTAITFNVDTSPRPQPQQTTTLRKYLASLNDFLILGLFFAVLIILIKSVVPRIPLFPVVIAAMLEAVLLAGITMILSVFFWGCTLGMHLVGLRVVDLDREMPDARVTLLWFFNHMISSLTLGVYGTLFPYAVSPNEFFIVEKSGKEEE